MVWALLPSCSWRLVLVLTTAPLWLALALARLVPESPRLDVVRGRPDRALRTLQHLALRNGRPMVIAALALTLTSTLAHTLRQLALRSRGALHSSPLTLTLTLSLSPTPTLTLTLTLTLTQP